MCTKSDLITTQGKIEKLDIVEQCTQERQNKKVRIKLITNGTFFAALLNKDIQMGSPDSVLPVHLLKIFSVNCPLSEKSQTTIERSFSPFSCVHSLLVWS